MRVIQLFAAKTYYINGPSCALMLSRNTRIHDRILHKLYCRQYKLVVCLAFPLPKSRPPLTSPLLHVR